MINVQIASQITTDGLLGVRWVLVDTPEPAAADASTVAPTDSPAVVPAKPVGAVADAPTPMTAASAPALAAHHRSVVATEWALAGLKLLVMALGLGVALWTAQSQFGPPAAAWRTAGPEPAVPAPAATLLPPSLPAPAPALVASQPLTPMPMPQLQLQPSTAPGAATGAVNAAATNAAPANAGAAPGDAPTGPLRAAPQAAPEPAPSASGAVPRLTAGL